VSAGERYLYGRGVARDCRQALVYFQAGAAQQNPRALSQLGTMYATGTCVTLNRVMAYNWFSRALAHNRSSQSLEENLNNLWRDMGPQERQQVLHPRQ
jgi:TPR repeat protein